jgi:hypothetical protein
VPGPPQRRLEKTEQNTESCEQAHHNIEIQNHKTTEHTVSTKN